MVWADPSALLHRITAMHNPAPAIPPHLRTPRRITITVPWSIYVWLAEQCEHEGRSLSNQAARTLQAGAGIR